jgi:hypothetical protein
MDLSTAISPLLRNKKLFAFLFLLIGLVLYIGYKFVPVYTKTTIYFSVKPVQSLEKEQLTDGVEGAEKLAEAIAGWAKDPGFREQILDASGVYVPKLKRKLSARKQNRINVFWTIKLDASEADKTDALTAGTIKTIKTAITQYNVDNIFPLQITPARTFTEAQTIPLAWVLPAILLLSLFGAAAKVYVLEAMNGKISYVDQVRQIFDKAPIIQIEAQIGSHDERILEQFILTFESPRLVGTFPVAGEYFTLAPADSINEQRDTAILMVKLGETPLTELQNLASIFGPDVGIIVFKK